MKPVTRLRCAACKKPIPDHEPDLVLRKLGSEKLRYYHTGCGGAAQRRILEDPDVWHITVRHVHEEMN